MITVTFLNGCILATAEQSLWQYSYNQQLQINGLELPGVFTVDFCNEGDTTTVAMIGSSGVVDIPNELLTSGRDIVAYVFQKSTLTGGITRCEIRIDVLTRPERDDETPTPEQEAVIDQYIAELNEGVEAAETAAANAQTSENNATAAAEDAQQSKADAAASASAAAGSASDASNSAAAAAQSAVNASNSAEDAAEAASEGIGYKEDSEAWAIGKRGGVDVGSSDVTYHNNSKYYAGQAAASSSAANSEAAAAAQSARDAAASANGAAQSAASATASKNAAANSADVAANAATAAQNHSISAASSATAASGSATAAANKATAAAQSATAAGNSATEAEIAREAAEDAQDAAEAAQAAAEAVLESIPSDYSELSEDVDDLKSALNAIETPTKNLLNCTFENAKIVGGVFQRVSNTTDTAEEEYIEVEANTQYYFSWESISSLNPVLYVYEYSDEKAYLSYTRIRYTSGNSPTFTTTATTKYVRINLYEPSATSWESLVPEKFQLEKGTSPTEYFPPVIIKSELIPPLDYVPSNFGTENAGKSLVIDSNGDVTAGENPNSESIDLAAINYALKIPKPIVQANCHNVSGWIADGTILSVGRKYNNITRQNVDCVGITSNSGNGLAYYNLDTPVDTIVNPLLIELSIGDYLDTNPPAGNVGIELFSGTGRTSTYKTTWIIQGNTQDASYNPAYNRNGWFTCCLFWPSIANFFVSGSSFDPTNVTAIGIHAYNTNNVPNTVWVSKLEFVPPMQKPGIVTIIDNFGVSVPAMADYAYSKGVRLNLSIIPGFYAGASGAPTCASKAELDRVAQQGHCIWNHTWTHAILNNLTYPQIQDQVNLAETWMQINGYGDYKEFVSNPSAKFNTATCKALLDSNAKMIFHKWVGSPTCVYVPYYPTLRCIPTTILDQEVSATMSATDIATVAQKAMVYGGITVVGFHGTYWELDDGASWKAYIDAIANIQNVYHYGLDEIYNGQWC